MPTYEYKCSKCGVVFEIFHSITEPARKKLKKGDPRPCSCNAPISRLIGTGGGIIFKGSGFYETDYRSENYTKAAKADSEASSGSKSDSDSKTADKKTPDNKAKAKSGDSKNTAPTTKSKKKAK